MSAPRAACSCGHPRDDHQRDGLCQRCFRSGDRETTCYREVFAPEGVTLTEWGVRLTSAPDAWMKRSRYYRDGVNLSQNEAHARATSATIGGEVVSRQRTTFPDVVTEWVEVTP